MWVSCNYALCLFHTPYLPPTCSHFTVSPPSSSSGMQPSDITSSPPREQSLPSKRRYQSPMGGASIDPSSFFSSPPPPSSEHDMLNSPLAFDTPTSAVGGASAGVGGSQGTPRRHRSDIASSYRIREVNLMPSDTPVRVCVCCVCIVYVLCCVIVCTLFSKDLII